MIAPYCILCYSTSLLYQYGPGVNSGNRVHVVWFVMPCMHGACILQPLIQMKYNYIAIIYLNSSENVASV